MLIVIPDDVSITLCFAQSANVSDLTYWPIEALEDMDAKRKRVIVVIIMCLSSFDNIF